MVTSSLTTVAHLFGFGPALQSVSGCSPFIHHTLGRRYGGAYVLKPGNKAQVTSIDEDLFLLVYGIGHALLKVAPELLGFVPTFQRPGFLFVYLLYAHFLTPANTANSSGFYIFCNINLAMTAPHWIFACTQHTDSIRPSVA